MLVWRVENDKGGGPYDIAEELGLKLYHSPPHQPGPRDDGIDTWRFTYNHVFGFASFQDCLNWFGRDTLRRAATFGYTVRCFSVPRPDVLQGGHQVAFRPDRAQPLPVVPLTSDGLAS